MLQATRRHIETILVSVVTAAIASGGTALAVIDAQNADKVDGYHANQLIRLAESHISNDAVVGSDDDAVIRQVTIVSPRAGYLVMMASTEVLNSDVSNSCWIELDGTMLTHTQRAQEGNVGTTTSCDTLGSWPVAKGSHTVRFMGYVATGTTYDEASLVVLFVPFNRKGEAPSPVPPA